MRILRAVLLLVGFASLMGIGMATARADEWLTDYPAALTQAKKEGKPVLVDFTGSTWCPPCIAMEKRVFDTQAFKGYALGNLVLLKVDFPDQFLDAENPVVVAGIKLAQDLGAINPAYGDGPTFPTLVMTDGNGKTLAVHHGPFLSPPEFFEWADQARAQKAP